MLKSGEPCFPCNHIPLGDGQTALGDGWCVELPSDCASNAVIAVLLTTQHPALQAHKGWAAYLSERLTAAAEAAVSGSLEELHRAWWVLKKRATSDQATCLPLVAAIEDGLSKSLLGEMKRHSPRGPEETEASRKRRFKSQTIDDHDVIAAQQEKDRIIRLGHGVTDDNGSWNDAGNNSGRALDFVESQTLAKNRFAVIDTEKVRNDAGTKRLLTHHRDVGKRAEPLRYVFTRCRDHAVMAEVSPDAIAWEGITPKSADVLMRSKTITFHPRAVLSPSEIESFGECFGGQWTVMVKLDDQAFLS